MTFVAIIMLLTLFHHYASATNYCASNMRCNGIENSGCNCNFGPNCNGPREHKLTDQIRKSILQAHNKYREKVASGAETRGGVRGGATEMYALQYDRELEYTANCWNKKCTFGHDRCRITERFRPAGQNLYWSSGRACNWDYNLEDATRLWYEEVVDMTPNCLRSYGSGCVTSQVGHFSQMVWAKTTHVGCSLVEYGRSCQIACNYGPAGNYLSEPVFQPGTPGSKCRYKSETFRSLCLMSADQETGRSEREGIGKESDNGKPNNAGSGGDRKNDESGDAASKHDENRASSGETRNIAQFLVSLVCILFSLA